MSEAMAAAAAPQPCRVKPSPAAWIGYGRFREQRLTLNPIGSLAIALQPPASSVLIPRARSSLDARHFLLSVSTFRIIPRQT